MIQLGAILLCTRWQTTVQEDAFPFDNPSCIWSVKATKSHTGICNAHYTACVQLSQQHTDSKLNKAGCLAGRLLWGLRIAESAGKPDIQATPKSTNAANGMICIFDAHAPARCRTLLGCIWRTNETTINPTHTNHMPCWCWPRTSKPRLPTSAQWCTKAP